MNRLKVIVIGLLLIVLFFTREKSFYPYQVNNEILYSTDSTSLLRWSLNESHYDNTEINVAQEYSIHHIGIQIEDSTHVKLEKIGRFLMLQLHHQLGNPSDTLFVISPWQQFQLIQKEKSEFYCTQYSAMFSFFCRVNHIATREIECKGINDRHIFNESYLPESNEWVFTDLTNGIISIRDERSRFLNLMELYNAIYSRTNNNYALTFSNDSIQLRPLVSYSARLRYNFDQQCRFYFYTIADLNSTKKPFDKLKRYVFNQPCFYTYSSNSVFKGWVFFKYISLILIIGLIISFFKHDKKPTYI